MSLSNDNSPEEKSKFENNLEKELEKELENDLENDLDNDLENNIKYTIIDDNPYYANRLRRTLISDIPTTAIDKVHIYKNTSPLIDELISHRLGLIVIKSQIDNNNNNDDIYFTLNVTCEDDFMYAKAGMLISSTENLKVINPDTIITILYKGEILVLKAFVKSGTGREHAKWMAVSAIGYKMEIISDNKNKYNKNKFKITLSIESVGSLTSEDILNQALEIMKNKTENNTLNHTQNYSINKYKSRFIN